MIARKGKDAMYVRTDQWLGKQPKADPDAMRSELLRRYLRCYGPSTVNHFADWVGITTPDARRAWDQIADRLVEVKLDGRSTWLHADDVSHLESPPEISGVRLLPPYDAYLDQRDRGTLVPDRTLQRQVWRILGNPGAVLADGQIVGLWRPQKKGKRLVIAVEPFATIVRRTRTEIEAEAALVAPLRGCTSVDVTYPA